jgi:hypothetical protein
MSLPVDNLSMTDVMNAFNLSKPISMSSFYGLHAEIPSSGPFNM